uniref:G-protein coupled receptors family 1 profile domain-containing protein n=1 Tax=Glossina brevipalpis TaxID=37001 RepID=A0A1A9WEC4_9MUSC
MNITLSANVASIPEISELANVAGDITTNLTEAVMHFTNSTMQLLNKNMNSTLDSGSSGAVTSQMVSLISLPTTLFEWLKQQHRSTSLWKTDNALKELLQNLSYTNAYKIKGTSIPFYEDIDDGIRREEHAPQLDTSMMIKAYVLLFMGLFSLLGNILTMWNIFKTRISRPTSRQNWSAIYFLIFHLSIADLLVTGFCIIGDGIWSYTVEWMAGNLSCKLVKFFQMFSLYLSTYVLVLIGIDRWIAVKYPMKSLHMAKRSHRLLGGIYGLSFLLSLPQFFIFHTARGPFIEEFYQCVTHGFYTAAWQEQFYTSFTLIFTFLLPLSILHDSHRTSSMLTAVTQVDCNGRTMQTYRQTCFFRSVSAAGGIGVNAMKDKDTELTQHKSLRLSTSVKRPPLIRQLSSDTTHSKLHYRNEQNESNEKLQNKEEISKHITDHISSDNDNNNNK